MLDTAEVSELLSNLKRKSTEVLMVKVVDLKKRSDIAHRSDVV